jgi:hypothetical protein
MRKELIKKRNFLIFIDKDVRGFGYIKMKEDYVINHLFVLFMFTICIIQNRPLGEKQIAKWITSTGVKIAGVSYTIHFRNYDGLKCIYYRNKFNTIIKSYDFRFIFNDKIAILDEVKGLYEVYDIIDVYIFNPEKDLEGYILDYVFIPVKEMSIG